MLKIWRLLDINYNAEIIFFFTLSCNYSTLIIKLLINNRTWFKKNQQNAFLYFIIWNIIIILYYVYIENSLGFLIEY